MRQIKQTIKKTGFLLFPIIILMGMTNCSQFQSLSDAQGVKFLSENPIFNGNGQDPHDDDNRPPVECLPGYTLSNNRCVPITCTSRQILVGNTCRDCQRGQRPNSDQTACIPVTCNNNQIRVGNTCQSCPAGEIPNAARTRCECSSGQSRNGSGQCISNRCPRGQVRNTNGQCVNRCTPGPNQIRVGDTCQRCPRGQRPNSSQTRCETSLCTPTANQIRVGGTCRSCSNGQRPNSDQTACVCPRGQSLQGGRCTPVCTSPFVLNSSRTACVCPRGQSLQGGRCVTPRPERCTPGPGEIRSGNTCRPCRSGYRPNSSQTRCERIPRPTTPGNGGDGGDGGGGGGGSPLMLDSEGVEQADTDQLRNSDESYFKSGELELTAPADGVKFNLLGQQTTAQLDNGDFLHIKPEAHNFKFQISWTQPNQTRYRWLTLPDENGHINGVDELFGDNTFGPNPEKPFARDGFRALMKWDRGDTVDSTQNLADGYIDTNDAVFSKLRLWHDLNSDGNCDTQEEINSELVTLDEVGITYIHLSVNENFSETDVHGNDIVGKSLVGFQTSSEGATRLGTLFDVWFQYDSREILLTGHAEIETNP